MIRRAAISGASGKWLLGVLIAVLAIGSVVLTLLALDHVRTRPADREVAPVPTFTQLAPQTPSPTPTETGAPVTAYDRSQERFLTASAGVLWRGIAGQCGVVEPQLERSADGGDTWTDVAPRYLGIGQLIALRPFADAQAEIIALMGDECEVQALRTFTQGQFWESYPEVLAASDYVDPADTGSIVRPDSTVPAPCADARSLRVAGPILATVCDGSAYLLAQNEEWAALPLVNVVALNTRDGDVLVAHVSAQCAGVTLTRYASTGDQAPEDARCTQIDESGPVAIAVSGDGTFVWAGPAVTTVSE